MASLKMIRKGHSPLYEVRWRDYESGAHKSRRVSDRTNARQLKMHGDQVEERTRLSRDLGTRRRGDIRLGYAIDEWKKQKVVSGDWSVKTLALRESAIRSIPKVLLKKGIRHINAGEIEAFLASRVVSAPSMVIQAKTVLSGAYRWALKNDLVERNIMDMVVLPSSTRKRTITGTRTVDRKLVLSPSDVVTIADTIDPWHRTFVLLMGFSGLRPGAASALLVDDIDLDRRAIDVHRNVKNEQSIRLVTIGTFLVDVLRQHINERGLRLGDSLWSNPRGAKFNYESFQNRHWRPTLKALQFADPVKNGHRRANGNSFYRPHDLRHTWASSLLRQGVNPAAVAKQLGHANASITLTVYASYFTEDTDDILKAANRIAAGL